MVIAQIEAFSGLAQYGFAGFFVLAMIGVVIALWRKSTASEERMYNELDQLKKDYNHLIIEGRDKLMNALENSVKTQDNSNKIMERVEQLFIELLKKK